jgi:hypothetical protein
VRLVRLLFPRSSHLFKLPIELGLAPLVSFSVAHVVIDDQRFRVGLRFLEQEHDEAGWIRFQAIHAGKHSRL